MKEKKVFIISDLGGGDGGKGGVVHKICTVKNVHTVIKVGGAQGSHGVRTSSGQSFNFGQFGCGTFEGVKTHISNLMVIDPYRLLQEADLLKYQWGIRNIFDYLTIDKRALCVTPFHLIASRLRELSRKDNPKGTVGIGIGEAVSDAELYPDLAIYASDLQAPNLAERLQAVKEQKIKDLSQIIEGISDLWPSDQERAKDLVDLLNDPEFISRIVAEFVKLGLLARIVEPEYLSNNILSRDGVAVIESSHGILTDKYYGFSPHTTQLRTLPKFNLLKDCQYDGDIITLGVTRAYQIRHGAGPMVTESKEFLDQILPGSSKNENRWQGKVRVGPLDFVALKYAIDVCGGPQVFTGLAVTWFDQIQALGKWPICRSYEGTDDRRFFWSKDRIKVSQRLDLGLYSDQLNHQKELSWQLNNCRPNIESYNISDNQDDLIRLCSEVFQNNLKIPVKMISFGPTETDKVCL